MNDALLVGFRVDYAPGLNDKTAPWIEVTVVREDGVVSYAELEAQKPPIRAWASTADRVVRWEYGEGGDWKSTTETATRAQLSDTQVASLKRAANAGLVAAGARP